jgi:hypothetical protein
MKKPYLILAAALAVCALAACSKAESQSPTYAVSLTLPNQYTDGSALPLSDLTSYTIAYKVGAATTYTTKAVNGPFTAAIQSTTIPKALGQTCVNAFVNVGTSASSATPDICVTYTGPPRAPTNLQVQ